MEVNKQDNNLMEKIISLCKRRGFIYQGSEIYGGLAGTWDYGPLGAELKHNIKDSWWKKFVSSREDMYGMHTAILMNPKVWEVAGHLENFTDPVEGQDFNTMFKTEVGSKKGETINSYLRPETAQGMFVNFKNIIDSFHPKFPFGLSQIGKVFRNEIAPRDFIFRTREFEQMEVEYFVKEDDWEKYFEYWKEEMLEWFKDIGIDMKHLHDLEVSQDNRAHYSNRTVDFEFDFPFGREELCGLSYRGDYDLKKHQEASGVDLSYIDDKSGEKFIPHVIEPTFGVDRIILALLLSVYSEDELGGEKRILLKFKPKLAPVKVAVFPLLRNKPELVEKARSVYISIKQEITNTIWDDNGNIGKRYRRQDEIGTPFCITIDFDTLKDETVTIRYRDTGDQERVKINELTDFVKSKM